MASEDIDPIYGYIDRKFEEIRTELLLDRSDGELSLESEVLRLRRVLVQTRKELAETYLQFTIHLKIDMEDEEGGVRDAMVRINDELSGQSIWFQGALQETSNPEAVYRWFRRTWQALANEGLEDALAVGHDVPPVSGIDS